MRCVADSARSAVLPGSPGDSRPLAGLRGARRGQAEGVRAGGAEIPPTEVAPASLAAKGLAAPLENPVCQVLGLQFARGHGSGRGVGGAVVAGRGVPSPLTRLSNASRVRGDSVSSGCVPRRVEFLTV